MSLKRKLVTELSKIVNLSLALKALGLNRSSYYYKPKVRVPEKRIKALDFRLTALLSQLKGYELTLGYMKTTNYIKHTFGHLGHWYNHKKVYRHMRILNLLQPKQIKKPHRPAKGGVNWYSPLKSNVRWEADLTYVSSQQGNTYLFTVIDTFDKEIIGSWFGLRCRALDAVKSLEAAILKRFPNAKVPDDLDLVLRIDRGCQYTAEEFGNCARKFNLNLEFCDVQAPNQKPFIESFFANFKREEVYRNDYLNSSQASSAWLSYVHWYNFSRPHASIGYLSPVQFRQKHEQTSLVLP